MKMNRKQGGVLALLLAVLAAITAWRFLPGYVTRPVEDVFAWGKHQAIHYELISWDGIRNIRQVMTKDPSTSRTLMWQSDFAEKSPGWNSG
jgi:acid phosphatase type 7